MNFVCRNKPFIKIKLELFLENLRSNMIRMCQRNGRLTSLAYNDNFTIFNLFCLYLLVNKAVFYIIF